MKDGQLQLDFHNIRLPLGHFHYDRFDTPDDEIDGKWSVNFLTNPQRDIDKAVMSLGAETGSGCERRVRSLISRSRLVRSPPRAIV